MISNIVCYYSLLLLIFINIYKIIYIIINIKFYYGKFLKYEYHN